jgi:hypothetical protein
VDQPTRAGAAGATAQGGSEKAALSPPPPTPPFPPPQLPEYAGQAALAALFLLTGRWLPALPHAALAGWHARAWRRGDAAVDVTEIFKQAPGEKRARAWRLAFYLLSFVYVIYRLVEASVASLLTPEGREVASRLLQDAAASHHV